MVVGLFVVVFTYYMQLYVRSLLKFQGFRGPHPLPMIGNCYKPKALFSLFRFMADLRKEFGKTFVMYLFTKPYLVVLEPTVVRRVLSDSKSFVKGVDYSSTFAVMFGEGLVTSGHEKHKRDRAIFNKYFIKSSVVKQTPMYNEVTERTIDQLLEAELEGKQEMNFNIERFFARLSLRVFMNYSTSTDYSNDLAREKEVSTCIQHSLVLWYITLINDLFYLRFVTWFRVRVTQLQR